MRSSLPSSTRTAPNRSSFPALLAFVALVGAPTLLTAQADERPAGRVMADVVESMESLDRMRSSLARSFLGEGGAVEVDQETFAQVCRPVGQRAIQLSSENPWQVRQMAVKYRNPAHEADALARETHRTFEENPGLQAVWLHDRKDGVEGYRYLRRITVEASCLACHGAADERPEFVRENYPEDRAYGFVEGDLRGVYSVFVPVDAAEDSEGGRPGG